MKIALLVIAVIGLLTTVGIFLIGLGVRALLDIKKTTDGIKKTVQGNQIHLAQINGAVIKNASDLVVHTRSDDKRETRHANEQLRRDQIIDQIWAKIDQAA